MELSNEEILQKIEQREIKPQILDEMFGLVRANTLRKLFLEKMTKADLSPLGKHGIPLEQCQPNIEMMFGAIQVPVGYIGPLPIQGDYAKGNFFIPMATTEGALLASANRGCSIIRKCDQVRVKVIRSAQTRSILLKSHSVIELSKVPQWVKENIEQLKEIAEEGSSFLKLQQIDCHIVGNNLWLRIEAHTGEAMGMNMITFCGERVGKFIHQKFPKIEFVSASGNICSDKKASSINLLKGRGKYVVAEIFIPDRQIKKYLKASAQQVFDLNYQKNWLGGMVSGSLGYNAHFANLIAAIYLATGQDLGHIVEGSQGFTTMDIVGGDLYVAVTLPCVQVGVIGGGTHLPHQKACLQMLGIDGPIDAKGTSALTLAEIVGAGVLAGELSLIGALAAHSLGSAHQALNR